MSELDRDALDLLLGQLDAEGVARVRAAHATDPVLARRTQDVDALLTRVRGLTAPAGDERLLVRLRSSVRRRLALRLAAAAESERARARWRATWRAACLAAVVLCTHQLGMVLGSRSVARSASEVTALPMPEPTFAELAVRSESRSEPRLALASRSVEDSTDVDPALPVPGTKSDGEFFARVDAVTAEGGADSVLLWLGARNALEALRVEFRQRFSREERRSVLAATGASPAREERIQTLAAEVGRQVQAALAAVAAGPVAEDPVAKDRGLDAGALSLGLRALLAAGSSRNVGEHRHLVRQATEVLLAQLRDDTPADVAMSILAAITDVAVVSGGREGDTVRRHAERIARATVDLGDRRPALLHKQTALSRLADAGYVLRLAPAFGAPTALCARARRLVLAHLRERLAVPFERPDVIAAILYGFGDLVDRGALDGRLVLWGARKLLDDYVALLHYAWGQYPLRAGWASFQDDLRYLSTLPTPAELGDAAALLMTLATNFAAPGSLELIARH